MIGLRVECDFPTCPRHFEAGAPELQPRAGVAPDLSGTRGGADAPCVILTHATVMLPDGWAVNEERGIVSVLCSHHAPK